MTRTALILAFFAASLFGCSVVSDIAETQKKAQSVAVALEKELGVKPFVGWDINNGVLTNVNVTFPVEGVTRLLLGELHAKVRVVVFQHFDTPPEELVVATFSKK